MKPFLCLISLRLIRQLMDQRDAGPAVIARDMAAPPQGCLSPEDPVATALQMFVSLDVAELPVVRPEEPERLLGMLARGDLVAAYNLRRVERLQQRAAAEA